MSGGRAVRVGCAAAGALAVALLAGGCLRAQVAAAIRADDTVTGEIVIAKLADDKDPGAVVKPPADLESRVQTQPYRQDGYAGTRVLFEGLTFDEFDQLNAMAGDEGNRLRFQLRRSGELVLFTGRVDLVQVPSPDRVDVGVRLSFPGRVTATNGRQAGNEITWRPPAGQVTELTATARYADPHVRPWTQWFALVGGLAAVVVLTVVLLAVLAHRRSVRSSGS